MELSIEIPAEAEAELREAFGADLKRATLEALAIEGYRSGRLSQYQVQRLLGLEDRWVTEAWLADHDVHMNYTIQDLEEDIETLNKTLGPSKS